jgi:hypothetical protein
LIGLDPTYMQLYNQDMFDTWVAITRGAIEQPSKAIYADFGARYVMSDLNHVGFLHKAEAGVIRIDVVKHSGSMVGYCVGTISSEREGVLESIYLEPAYRGEALGDT